MEKWANPPQHHCNCRQHSVLLRGFGVSTPLGPSCGRSLCTHLRLNMVHSVPIHFLTHVVHSLNNVSSYVTTQIIIFHHCRRNPLATHQKKNLQCKAIRQTQTLSKQIATGGSRTLKYMLLHKHGSWCMHFVGCIGLWSRCPPFCFGQISDYQTSSRAHAAALQAAQWYVLPHLITWCSSNPAACNLLICTHEV